MGATAPLAVLSTNPFKRSTYSDIAINYSNKAHRILKEAACGKFKKQARTHCEDFSDLQHYAHGW